MQTAMTILCLSVAGVGLCLGVGSFLYYRRQLRLFSNILNTFENGKLSAQSHSTSELLRTL